LTDHLYKFTNSKFCELYMQEAQEDFFKVFRRSSQNLWHWWGSSFGKNLILQIIFYEAIW